MGDENDGQTEGQSHGGGNPPTFSGRMRDYEDWTYDAENWKFNTKVTKEKVASRLYGAQTVQSVKSVMKKVTVNVLQSEKGWDEVMKQMDNKFMPKKETTAWTAFDELEDMQRGENETSEDFISRFEITVADIVAHDPQFGMGERMTTMMIMKRLCISKDHRATLLTKMQTDYSTRSLTDAIHESFVGDVPHTKSSKNADSAMSADDDETIEWHENGSITVTSEDGRAWFPAAVAKDVAVAYYTKKKFGKGGKKGGKGNSVHTGKKHPAEGDGEHVKNARGLKCYDCDSPYHFAGHEKCQHNSGYFIRSFEGFAGLAAEIADEDSDEAVLVI